MTDIQKSWFEVTSPLNDASFESLKKILSYRTIAKDQVFVKEKQKNNSEYFIVSGYCRSFLCNPKGDEITLSFFKPGSVLPPHLTRTINSASTLNLQALTEIQLVEFDAAKFLSLMITNIEIRDFGNTILKNALMLKTEKEMNLVSLTAKDRLIKFRKDFAILENLIPHPMIASYIGVTNVSLSRLRSTLLKA